MHQNTTAFGKFNSAAGGTITDMGTTGMNATLGMTGMNATPMGADTSRVPFSPNSNLTKKPKNKKISPRDKKINKISFRGDKDTAAATADNFGTVYTNADQSTNR